MMIEITIGLHFLFLINFFLVLIMHFQLKLNKITECKRKSFVKFY